jgi:parvulin-like peptidyl-prolyl isomerase
MKLLKTIISLIILITAARCSQPKSDVVVATFGMQKITVGDLQENLQQVTFQYSDELKKNSKSYQLLKKRTLDELIDRQLLLNHAVQKGTDVKEEELNQEIIRHKSQYTEISFQNMLKEAGISQDQWLVRKRENLIIKKYLDHLTDSEHPVTPEQIQAYYQQHPEQFQQPEAVQVRQIVTETKEKAEAILRRLRSGENFAKLARDLSLSPDRKQGGDLGFIMKGSIPREFEICFQMNPGEISPIIPSAYGFHLFKIIEKRPAKQLSLPEVEGKIAMQLKLQAREDTRTALLAQLKQANPVQIDEKTLAKVQ